ncbi:zinc finger protein 311-like isoform X2 [Hyposmocoma kahamanoa]|uniref:zinc finger protein 311-like isoform X2 n=1 Tax=Hyposmocoma kahamanoa TaxID=1477025 RepID=UPI000E6D9B89|nr:zinc finger protein 311-like isoform X2 [Hyposmocoma kahamanoa]
MDDICRLCCSTKFVNNYIFDEENALYLKMSLYLPIKVFKNDRLPQKVCDRCSCKVNDIYQFCNETIEVQNRLRAVLISSACVVEDSIDLTLIKQNDLSPLPPAITELGNERKPDPNAVLSEQSAQQIPSSALTISAKQNTEQCKPQLHAEKTVQSQTTVCHQSTQTDSESLNASAPAPNDNGLSSPHLYQNVRVKEEPKHIQVKIENEDPSEDGFYPGLPSDGSEDDMSLIQFKKKKSPKSLKKNGQTQKKKKKSKIEDWDMLMRALPEGTALTVVDNSASSMNVEVKQERLDGSKAVKSEPVEYHCCICFVQCYSRNEMLQHYKEHGAEAESRPAPADVPPPPDAAPLKCPRCQKVLQKDSWAAHWRQHWERDRRPYRCALCEKAFRDHHQVLKHGLTHEPHERGAAAGPAKRFVCDLCPEGFVYMRCLLAHRTRAHPEAAARALALRCVVCARAFAHLNSLRRHLRAHSGERNFLCNICGKALSSREHLKFHLRIHAGYKPNVCGTCGKGFVKKCNLTLHERVHSGEKPHVCSHCGKAFSQRSTLVIHERYHSGARPYVCPLCGRGFVAKGLLSMHLKTTCI